METKKQIVAKLKEAGFNSRQVSVRNRPGGYESSFVLTIRDAAVNPETIEAIAAKFERIDRDQFGDILAGGNTYVNVSVDESIEKIWAAAYTEQVQKAIDQLQNESQGVNILEQYYVFLYRPGMYSLSCFDNEGGSTRIGYNCYYSAEGMAIAIAKHKMKKA